ncbi:hypothetical protein F4775DRAFT_76648 [Biscogniauxia sp. FL1348]|nr:hypothetical protein F4775DRAFT_76648 [Biscogniauxia sp. FL1348]
MCLFPYPAHPTNSKKGKKTKKPAKREDIQETTREVIDEAVSQIFSAGSSYATAPVRILSRNRIGCEMDYWPEEYRHAHVTQGQWNDHKETLKKTYDMVGDNGKNIDGLRDTMGGEGEVTRDAIKETHNSVKDTQGAVGDAQDAINSAHIDIKNSLDAITSTHHAVRDAQEMMMKAHGEQISKQADCVAEIETIRKLLEEDARKRDEAERKQQTMQEAWNYAQWLRQADRDANQFSRTRSSSRSTSSRRSESRRRYKTPEESGESGRRRQRERESEDSLIERLERVLSSTEKANKNREEDSRHCGYGPGCPPQWAGADWGDYRGGAWHYSPSQNYFYDDCDSFGDTRGYVPPYRRPFRHGTTGGGPSWEQRSWHR